MKTATPTTHRQPPTAQGAGRRTQGAGRRAQGAGLNRAANLLAPTGHGLFQAQGSCFAHGLALGLRPDGNFGGGSPLVHPRKNFVSLGQISLRRRKDFVDDGQSFVRDGRNLFAWEETFSMTDKTPSETRRLFSMADKTLSAPDKTQSVTDQTTSAPDKTPSAAKNTPPRAEYPTIALLSPLSGRQRACSKTQQTQSIHQPH